MFWENKFEVLRVVNSIKDGENGATRVTDYVGLAMPRLGTENTYRYVSRLA
jgi:hypothetical protein